MGRYKIFDQKGLQYHAIKMEGCPLDRRAGLDVSIRREYRDVLGPLNPAGYLLT